MKIPQIVSVSHSTKHGSSHWYLPGTLPVVRGDQGGLRSQITSGQKLSSSPTVLVLLVGINSNKRLQITAKSSKDLFVGKKHTYIGTERAAQLSQTELNALILGRNRIYTPMLECP